MEIDTRDLVTALHGMLFGGFFLMAIFGLILELYRSSFAEQPWEATSRGKFLERLYLILLVSCGWIAVLSGAYLVYPWYRAIPPPGAANLAFYPQRILLSSPETSGWHRLGMEWKEYVAWIAPIAITMVSYVTIKNRPGTKDRARTRTAVLVFAIVAFGAAGVAGFFGAMIEKAAPVKGGPAIYLLRESK